MKPFKAEWCLDDVQLLAASVPSEPKEPRKARRRGGRAKKFRGGRRRRPVSAYRALFD